ncbi:MAG: aminopeptidase P family protein [Armatimonadetes bacterium]|nr:aminopeptidase P family protein [Armatimonadota bacterium]
MSNVKRLRNAMSTKGVDAILVTDMTNIRWLSGFTGSSAVCLVTAKDAIFITDSRYTIQAGQQVSEMDVKSFGSPKTLDEFITDEAKACGVSELHFESSVTFSTYEARKNAMPDITWKPAPELIRELRMIKTPDEITKIKDACKLADALMEHIQRMLKIGVSEYDICLDIEFFYRRNGAQLAFDPIVVSGPNSARPHGVPGERKLQAGDFLTIDCGANLNGYNSDITRSFVVGEPTPRHEEVYNQVLKAEVECCKALQVGKTGVEIDALARQILDEKDLAQYFGHGLGHGLGLNVHDPGGLSPRSKETMAPGMVFTVEPGVYIEGFGGVRIEDDVLVTENGPEILTHFPKELTVVG